MVDFRYHLVSIIAIFMALALGIIVGTTQLNDQVLSNLKGSISSLTKDKRNLEDTTRQLQGQVGQADAFIESAAGSLVGGDLRGESVLLVTTPDTPSDAVEQLRPLLRQAGAAVVGRLQVKSALVDPGKSASLDDLVTAVRPVGTTLSGSEPVARAAALLAASVVRSRADLGITEAAADRVLGGFEGEGLIDLEREPGAPRRATLTVLLVPAVGPEPATERDLQRNRGILALAAAMDSRSAGVVMAGPLDATRDAGALAAARSDDALDQSVSTVDGADRPLGRVLVVKALRDQLQGLARRYGGGSGASTLVPTPAPT